QAIFDDKVWEVPLPQAAVTQRRPRDMTWVELRAERSKLLGDLDKLAGELSEQDAKLQRKGGPADLPVHIHNLQDKQKSVQALLRQVDVEMLMRPALSLGCMFFILVGCPVGIWFSRSDYLSSFITCFLPIVMFYYPLTLCGTQMAKEGRI